MQSECLCITPCFVRHDHVIVHLKCVGEEYRHFSGKVIVAFFHAFAEHDNVLLADLTHAKLQVVDHV